MTEDKLRAQIDRGARSDTALKEMEAVFGELEKKCFENFKACDVHDAAFQKTLKCYLMVLHDVRERCRLYIQQGADAQKELMRIKEPSKLKRVING